jgi:hypothetical protein
MKPKNRFQGIISASLCTLAGRDDNPVPTGLLAPIDCLKIRIEFQTEKAIILYNVVNISEEHLVWNYKGKEYTQIS